MRRPFAVVRDHAGQFDADFLQRVGERFQFVLPSDGSPPALPLASSSTVSLVLMCPSTLMQLKLASAVC